MSREVPDGWRIASLDDICSHVARGDAPKYSDKTTGLWALGQRCIREEGIDWHHLRPHSSEKRIKELSVLRPGDVCINSTGTGTLGRVGFWTGSQADIVFADTHITVLRANVGEVWPRFLYEWLRSDSTRARIYRECVTGSTNQIELSRSSLKSLSLLLPPLHEQRRIAEILSSVDEAIATTHAVIDQTRKVKQGVLEHLLTKGIGHTLFKQTELGEMPERWEIAELQDIASVRTGLAKNKKEIPDAMELPYLRVANVQDGYVDLSDLQTISVSPGRVERYSLRKGDVLMTEGGDYDKLGRGDVWDGSVEPCLHQNHVFAVRANPERLIPEFLAILTASRSGKAYFQSCSKRSTNLASINSAQVKQFPVRLPDLREQSEIVKISKSFDAAISVATSRLGQQRRLKSALMSDLLTGRKRITDAFPMAAE